jgi:hypothetical protein
LRKAITTVAVGLAVAVGATGVASAAGSHVSTKKCGTKYTPACPPKQSFAKPSIKTPPVNAACVSTGAIYRLPTMTFKAPAGIRTIQVRDGSRTVKTVSFRGHKTTTYTLRNLVVQTLGLGAGGHSLSVRVTDAKGRSASKTLRFSVCVATPVFTG